MATKKEITALKEQYYEGKKEITALKEQLNHLGGHLKNLIYHIDEIYAKLLVESDDAKRNRNYSKKALIRKIKGTLDYSLRWIGVPKKEVYQWNPLDLYKKYDWWKEKKKDRYFVDENMLDSIYPNRKELETLLDESDIDKSRLESFELRSLTGDASTEKQEKVDN